MLEWWVCRVFFSVGKVSPFVRPLATILREAPIVNGSVHSFTFQCVGIDLSSFEMSLLDVYVPEPLSSHSSFT